VSDIQYRRDIEEPDEVLDYAEEDPTGFWEQRQRDLVTSILNYNLESLSALISSEKIDLSPNYQRRFRWDPVRQSRLIESFLMNVPVPPIFLNEDNYGRYSVIDGKQRLTAIYEFMRGRLRLRGLKVFSEVNGQTIDDLPLTLQNVLQTRAALQAVIILRQSDQDVKFEVFQRLNTGGVKLNPQEIRNSTWPGPFNNLVLDLSTSKSFHRLLGITNQQRSAIYKEMRDAELVLRYFTFRDTWATFSGGMKRRMDDFMAGHQGVDAAVIEEMRADFLHTLEVVGTAFGEYAFRRWVPEKGQWRRQVLASLYDAQMFAARGLNANGFSGKEETVVSRMKTLFDNADFRRSIDAATNTPMLFRSRIKVIRSMLQEVEAESRG
jgi:hypothetical protein